MIFDASLDPRSVAPAMMTDRILPDWRAIRAVRISKPTCTRTSRGGVDMNHVNNALREKVDDVLIAYPSSSSVAMSKAQRVRTDRERYEIRDGRTPALWLVPGKAINPISADMMMRAWYGSFIGTPCTHVARLNVSTITIAALTRRRAASAKYGRACWEWPILTIFVVLSR